jgi:hypothetical protein
MKIHGFLAVLLATLFVTSLAFAADDVAFPEIKDAKLLQDDWYGKFAEGKKAGYSNTKISEVKYNDKECLLVVTTDFGQVTVGDKAVKRDNVTKALVLKDNFAPLYYSSNTVTPVYKLSEVAKFEQKGKGWVVSLTTKLNDKSQTDTVNVDNCPMLYADAGLQYMYGQKMLKNKGAIRLAVLDTILKASNDEDYTYSGETKEGEGDKARTFTLVKAQQSTIWFGPDGKMERSIISDGIFAQILSDEKTAKNFDEKWPGYKKPDYLAGDVLTIASAGVKMHRPSAQYFFAAMFDANIFVVADPINEMAVIGLFICGVPDGADPKHALELFGPSMKEFKFGDGKMIDIGKRKCLSGDLTRGAGMEAGSGKYYIIIENGAMIFLLAAGQQGVFAGAEKDMMKYIETMEFVKPVFDESKLLVTDKAAGLKLKLPNPGWVTSTPDPRRGITSMVVHVWSQAVVLVQTLPAQEGLTMDALVKNISNGKKVTGQGDMKVGKVDAKWMDTEETANDQTIVRRYIIMPHDKGFIVILGGAEKETWNKMKTEIESVLKSVEFTEEKPKDETKPNPAEKPNPDNKPKADEK